MLHERDATFFIVASRMRMHLIQDQEQQASDGNKVELASARSKMRRNQKGNRTIIGDDALRRLQNSVTSQRMRIPNASGR